MRHRLSPILLSPLLLAAAPPPDALHYSIGGLMSGPAAYDIDLQSGRFIASDTSRVDQIAHVQDQGTLAPETRARLRRLALAAIRAGFETRQCRASRAPIPPMMDAIPNLTLMLRGRTYSAPANPTCWTPAANALQGAAYQAVHPSADK